MCVRLPAEDRLWRVVARRARALAAILALGSVSALACSPAAAPVEAAAPEAPAEAVAAPPPLLPLTGEEQRLREEVEGEVGALAELGPRSLAHSWNLHSATDLLARKLETYGYEVVRQGF